MESEEKYLLVTFDDGTSWEIPAEIFAHQRADYFAMGDEQRYDAPYAETYAKEFEYTLGDTFEILDWANNNVDWEDIRDIATLVWFRDNNPPNNDEIFQQEWTNAHKEIITKGNE